MKHKRYNRFFHQKEFACPDTGQADMSGLFILQLTSARIIAGIPFIITNGYRSDAMMQRLLADPEYTAYVDPDSVHPLGRAADIRIRNGRECMLIVQGLLRAGLNRIGIGKNHIHTDNSQTKPQNVLWRYPD